MSPFIRRAWNKFQLSPRVDLIVSLNRYIPDILSIIGINNQRTALFLTWPYFPDMAYHLDENQTILIQQVMWTSSPNVDFNISIQLFKALIKVTTDCKISYVLVRRKSHVEEGNHSSSPKECFDYIIAKIFIHYLQIYYILDSKNRLARSWSWWKRTEMKRRNVFYSLKCLLSFLFVECYV